MMSVQKNMSSEAASDQSGSEKAISGNAVVLVKVSMDGAPYLRKVDLSVHKSYQQLSDALAKMFSSFTIGKF